MTFYANKVTGGIVTFGRSKATKTLSFNKYGRYIHIDTWLEKVTFHSIYAISFIHLMYMQCGYQIKWSCNFFLEGGTPLCQCTVQRVIASHMANYDWPFGTLPFGLFGSNLDTGDLETYPRTYSGHFWNMSIFDDSRAIWVLFRKWVVSENQSFLNEGAIITPLLV